MCGGNARGETPGSLAIACPTWSGAEPYIALVVGGHDKLGSLEARNELAGLSSGSVPCAVVWSLVMSELIQMMDFEWPWTYEHIRTRVCFGLNVLGGGVLVHSCRSRN